DLPGMNTAGFNVSTISDRPLEVCMTINDHWGYSKDDHNVKSSRHLVHLLARSASVGANYLLNVGPTAEGEILPAHAQRLRGVGQWLDANGESIYGTRAGAVAPSPNVVSTRRGDTHYIHLLNHTSDSVTLTDFAENVSQAHLLRNGEAVSMEHGEKGLVITVPEEQRDPIDTVVVLS
ncbi:MAG: alpha-L-fucosidase, partial [Anaerolineae bacterium]|nr:alpha-L-fucosidase [Anaerolineae bacterium]